MAPERGVTVALDGFGAEQGFDVLAEGARRAAADGIARARLRPRAELSASTASRASRWSRPRSGSATRRTRCRRSARKPGGLGRARRRATSPTARADAMVSPGSTGATMAAATFGLRRLKGVQRPALAVRLPVPGKPVLFLDVGANVEVRAQHLVQFAFLGAAFSAAVLGVERPQVGLLSVGEEAGKGREEVVEAHGAARRGRGIEFVGNVEGRDLPGRRGRRRRHRRLHRQRRR